MMCSQLPTVCLYFIQMGSDHSPDTESLHSVQSSIRQSTHALQDDTSVKQRLPHSPPFVSQGTITRQRHYDGGTGINGSFTPSSGLAPSPPGYEQLPTHATDTTQRDFNNGTAAYQVCEPDQLSDSRDYTRFPEPEPETPSHNTLGASQHDNIDASTQQLAGIGLSNPSGQAFVPSSGSGDCLGWTSGAASAWYTGMPGQFQRSNAPPLFLTIVNQQQQPQPQPQFPALGYGSGSDEDDTTFICKSLCLSFSVECY
jgi:hypothetical protein